MKALVFENIFTHELWQCGDPKDVRVIDGVEYLVVNRHAQNRAFMMRKDSLKKVVEKAKTA